MYDLLKALRWQDIADITIVAFLIYRLILLIRGTRAMQMVLGIAVIVVAYFAARELEFMTLYWLLGTFLSSLFLIIIIVFQRDIRRALTSVGQTPFSRPSDDATVMIEAVVAAAAEMARRKTGALIVIERETGLKDYFESGQRIDGLVSRDLLLAIFHTGSPLHDGGVVVRGDRLAYARCLMPLSKNPYISKRLGTRHRAAIGISEETDAVVVVVSEETGSVSLVQHGAITTNLDENSLRSRLRAIFAPPERPLQLWKAWRNKS